MDIFLLFLLFNDFMELKEKVCHRGEQWNIGNIPCLGRIAEHNLNKV